MRATTVAVGALMLAVMVSVARAQDDKCGLAEERVRCFSNQGQSIDTLVTVKTCAGECENSPTCIGRIFSLSQATITGSWSPVAVGGIHNQGSGQGVKSVKWDVSSMSANTYDVAVSYANSGTRAVSVPVVVVHAGGSTTVFLNQQLPAVDGNFQPIGSYVNPVSVTIATTGTDGKVIANQLRLECTPECVASKETALDIQCFDAQGNPVTNAEECDCADLDDKCDLETIVVPCFINGQAVGEQQLRVCDGPCPSDPDTNAEKECIAIAFGQALTNCRDASGNAYTHAAECDCKNVVKTPAPVSETPSPVSDTPAPVSQTPAPVKDTPAPAADDKCDLETILVPCYTSTGEVIGEKQLRVCDGPCPNAAGTSADDKCVVTSFGPAITGCLDSTGNPYVHATACDCKPVVMTPAPVSDTPSPVKDTPAPVSQTPAPVTDDKCDLETILVPCYINGELVGGQQLRVCDGPCPSDPDTNAEKECIAVAFGSALTNCRDASGNAYTHAAECDCKPVVKTPAPVSDTPSPVSDTPAPVSQTPAPVSDTPAPVVDDKCDLETILVPCYTSTGQVLGQKELRVCDGPCPNDPTTSADEKCIAVDFGTAITGCLDSTGNPYVHATACDCKPVVMTPAPVSDTPSPVKDTPAPVSHTPAPTTDDCPECQLRKREVVCTTAAGNVFETITVGVCTGLCEDDDDDDTNNPICRATSTITMSNCLDAHGNAVISEEECDCKDRQTAAPTPSPVSPECRVSSELVKCYPRFDSPIWGPFLRYKRVCTGTCESADEKCVATKQTPMSGCYDESGNSLYHDIECDCDNALQTEKPTLKPTAAPTPTKCELQQSYVTCFKKNSDVAYKKEVKLCSGVCEQSSPIFKDYCAATGREPVSDCYDANNQQVYSHTDCDCTPFGVATDDDFEPSLPHFGEGDDFEQGLAQVQWLPSPQPTEGPIPVPTKPWAASVKTVFSKRATYATTVPSNSFTESEPRVDPEDETPDRATLIKGMVADLSWEVLTSEGEVYDVELGEENAELLLQLDERTPISSSGAPPTVTVDRSIDEIQQLQRRAFAFAASTGANTGDAGEDSDAAGGTAGVEDDGVSVKRERRYVFWGDQRVRVPCGSENFFPTKTIGKVTTGCTGVMVGPKHVLTAGHCVHEGDGGNWLDPDFIPRRNCDSTHAPDGTYSWRRIYSVKGWTKSGKWDHDYALIELWNEPHNGWMSFGYHNGMSKSWNMNVRGYQSQDKPNHEIYNMFRNDLKSVSSKRIKHYNDIVKGTSGAPMYLYSNGNRIIYGIQSHHYCPSSAVSGTENEKCSSSLGYNGATRITGSRFSQICGWINDNRVC